MRIGGNAYDLREVSGAFGDLGTLVPFVVGYLTINGLDPVGVLVGFGLFKIVAGLYFRTPVPVQPMKAIGTQAIAHAATITPGAIWASGLFTGVVWLALGLTGAISWVARITGRPVVQGLVLGLGLSFVVQGVRMMEGDFVLGVIAVLLTFKKASLAPPTTAGIDTPSAKRPATAVCNRCNTRLGFFSSRSASEAMVWGSIKSPPSGSTRACGARAAREGSR